MSDIPTVVVACWPGDQDQALRLFAWIAELGRVRAPLLLIASDECDLDELQRQANMAFDSVTLELDVEKVVSDWSSKEAGPKSAAGPNSLWKRAAWYFNLPKPKGSWMFLEPDAVPLVPDWFDILSAEYKQKGMPFMGALVQGPRAADKHMSGVAFYPAATPAIMTEAMQSLAVAFDVADAPRVLEMAHITTRIIDKFRAPPFTSMEDFDARVPKGATLFHACKDGSILPYVRQRLGLVSGPNMNYDSTWATVRLSPTVAVATIPESTARELYGTPVVDIYIKSWQRDHELLNLLLKSIHKFVTGYRNIIIESENSPVLCWPAGIKDRVRLIECKDEKPGYLYQQKKKLECHQHSDAPYFLWVDSDCCFNRPVDVSEFFVNGKTKWRYTPLDLARPDQSSTWVPVMRKFIGQEPTVELMREHPTLVPRWLLDEVNTFCRYKHGMTIGEYAMAQADPQNDLALNFSEINCAGFFAWTFHHDRFEWVPDDKATPCLVQGHTWAGAERIQQDIEKYREILGLNESVIPTVGPDSLKAPKLEMHLNLDAALELLQAEASKSPLHKARLMKRITAALAKAKPARNAKAEGFYQHKGYAPEEFRFVLAVQTYPGGNDTLTRHVPYFEKSGASRLVAITTTDGNCSVPEGWQEVAIGENKYIAADHLPRRLLGILEWFVKQPEEHIAICEYDNVLLKPIKPWKGTCLVPAGGKLPNAKASTFFHCPFLLDRESCIRLIPQMHGIIAEGGCDGPEASPDVFLSYAIDRAGIEVNTKHFTMFTRNTILNPEDVKIANEYRREGVDAIHGIKSREVLEAVLA